MFWPSSGGGVPTHVPSPDQRRELVLYKYDSCPYCQRVLRALDKLGLEVEMRDTMLSPEAREELYQRTGRTQVPCLFIDGEALFESMDIVSWLEVYARNLGAPEGANPDAV